MGEEATNKALFVTSSPICILHSPTLFSFGIRAQAFRLTQQYLVY